MDGGPRVDGALAVALADQRERCNAIVAAARRSYVDFDVLTLEQQIRGPLAVTVAACERASPGSGRRVVAALFEPLVELVGQHRLGGGSHDALLARLPCLARLLVDEPRRIFASLANAIVQLGQHGAPPEEWLRRIEAAAASGEATATLRAGEVAAWALGLSHFRESALEVAATLSEPALAAALGASQPIPVAAALARLRDDRWWRPGRTPPAAPAVAHRVGGFRGFGGPFLSPPALATRDGGIVVRAGEDAWILHADAFGATLTRTDPDGVELRPTRRAVVPQGLRPTSAVAVADVTALTMATSYQVLVVEPGAPAVQAGAPAREAAR